MRRKLFSSALVVLALASVHGSTGLCEAPETFPIPGSGTGPMSPVVAELDGNAANGLETVIATPDGRVQMLSSAGVLIWSAETPNVLCAATPANDKLYSSPVVGDLFGTGEMFVVVGYGGFRGKVCDGGVVAYRASTGALAWVFSIKEFSKRQRFFAFRHAVYGTPTLADVDRDGRLEVGFGSFDRNVYLLNADGSVRWYYNAADTVFPSPRFLDVAGNADLEMIIGTDISKNTRLRPPTPNGGYVYALKAAVPTAPDRKFTFRSSELQAWRTTFNQVMQTTIAIGEILPDNLGLELVTGSGCFFPQGSGDRRGKWYKVLSARTGKVLKTLPVTACTPSAAAVGDINSDGIQEVVVTVSGTKAAGGDGTSRVIAWRPATDEVLWSVQPKVGRRTDSYGGHHRRTPVLADVQGDGTIEVLINHHTGVVVLAGATGEQLTCDSSPCTKPLLALDSPLQGSPVVVDSNLDGVQEIITVGRRNRQSVMARWKNPF
jgi:outer membrane protein assembly factor BamB